MPGPRSLRAGPGPGAEAPIGNRDRGQEELFWDLEDRAKISEGWAGSGGLGSHPLRSILSLLRPAEFNEFGWGKEATWATWKLISELILR